MPSPQHYPEPTVGALIFDPAGRLFLMRSHKWGGRYVVPGVPVIYIEHASDRVLPFGPGRRRTQNDHSARERDL